MIATALLANLRLVSPLLQLRVDLVTDICRVRERLLIRAGRHFRHGVPIRHTAMCRRTGHTVTPNELEFRVRRNVIFETEVRQRPASVGLAFFFAEFVELLTKNFPIDERVEIGKKVVDLINFVKLVFRDRKTNTGGIFS